MAEPAIPNLDRIQARTPAREAAQGPDRIGGEAKAPDRVSVILAARDMATYLPETLASLDAQTLDGFEVVAVDDGSTDATGAILRRAAETAGPRRPYTVLRTDGIGLSAARNLAMRAAGGSLLTTLDGDDVLLPPVLEAALRAFEGRSELDLVYPLCDHVGPDGTFLGMRSTAPKGPLTPATHLLRTPIHTDSGVTFRRSAAQKVGGFDADLTGCIGMDFWYRLLSLRPANAACLGRSLVLYRRRPGQITARADRMERNFERFLAKRAQGGPPVDARLRQRALAAQRLYWASIAYADGEYARARSYTASAWRTDPASLATTRYAYVRAGISLVSLLPSPVHRLLERIAHSVLARR